MLYWDIVECLSRNIFKLVANTAISCLSTQWTAELFWVLSKADVVVNADIVANMSHSCQTLNGLVDGAQIQDMQLGAFRDNCKDVRNTLKYFGLFIQL